MKLATVHKKPGEYQLMQAHATYMQSKGENAMPQLNDMAGMFTAKYLKDGHMEKFMQSHVTESGESIQVPPQYFVQLTFQIMLHKFFLTKDATKFHAAI